MNVRLLDEATTRRLMGPAEALVAARLAFQRLGRGEVELPAVLTIEVPAHHGEVHAKGGYLHGEDYFSIKVATGFYRNPALGLPITSGAVWVFSAHTGQLAAMILDNGYLTELRTGAAGAVAADLLARERIQTVGVIGAGGQARYQLEALLGVRRPERVLVWGPRLERARRYADEMAERFGISVTAVSTAEAAIRPADLVVTATPAEEPIVRAEWVKPGTHVTAIGSDMPRKRELEPALLARARVVADRLDQCLTEGEVHHAVAAGMLVESAVVELGAVAAGLAPGRQSAEEITIADLTGIGVLDAAVAGAVLAKAIELGEGRWLEP